jgi:hypothetical protein
MKKLRGMLWKPGVNGLGVGPKWLRRLLPYRKRFHEAALHHDVRYDKRGGDKERCKYDIAFLEDMIYDSSSTLQVSVAVVYFYAVRVFGWLFYRYDRATDCNPSNGTKE